MNTQNKVDALDEALRIIYLEGAKESDEAVSEMKYIMSLPVTKEMTGGKKSELITKLGAAMNSLSLGQVIQTAMANVNLSDEQLAASASLPASVLTGLKEDKIYTNSVPIMFFKKLLNSLNIHTAAATQAIRKTLEILQSQKVTEQSFSGFRPAFRRGIHSSESMAQNIIEPDGKDLFENKEAMENYITRLEELMKD